MIECQDVFVLSGDKTITNINSFLSIDKKSGNITELQEGVKTQTTPNYYSGFLGIINISGVNFLMFVKEVHILFALDGKDKIYEMVSLDFI